MKYLASSKCFFNLLSLALLVCVAQEIIAGYWKVHTGEFFPWSHHSAIWMSSPFWLLVSWFALVVSSILLNLEKYRRQGVALALVAMTFSILGRYSNQYALIVIVLFHLLITKNLNLSFKMLRYQLFIVYFFSAFNKIDKGFWNGVALSNLSEKLSGAIVPQDISRLVLSGKSGIVISYTTIVLELLLPLVLLWRPRLGFGALFLMHLGFMFMMPWIYPFTIVMIALGTLFLRK